MTERANRSYRPPQECHAGHDDRVTEDPEGYLLNLASRCISRMMEADEGFVATASQQGMAELFGAADALVAVADFDRNTAERIKGSVIQQVHQRLLALGLAEPVEVSMKASAEVEVEDGLSGAPEPPP